MVSEFLARLDFEYKQRGLRHVLVGGVEAAFLKGLEMIPTIYWRVAPKYYRWRASDDIYEYNCSPDPFKIELVNPHRIRKQTDRPLGHLNRRKKFGRVIDGDWDITGGLIDEQDLYKSAKAHFCNGVRWEDTKSFQTRIQKVKSGEYSSGKYSSGEDVINRFSRFDDLYKKIDQSEYISQEKLLKEGETNDGLYWDILDEVTVDVGRDGELLHVDGSHRLVIAKILDLDKIPVVFLVRHEEWMKYRDEVCQSDEKVPDHPDLRDLK